MGIKLSHSAINKFQDCPKAYDYRYNHKFSSIYKSGALYFGSAIDDAMNEMLEMHGDEAALKETDFTDVFDKKWTYQPNSEYKVIYLPTDVNVLYSASDFDKDLLLKEDVASIKENASKADIELTSISDFMDDTKKLKAEKGWENVDKNIRQLYNYINWCSLRRKGHLMVNWYKDHVMPTFDRVLAVQKYVKMENEEGDVIRGYIDLVVQTKTGLNIVFDNKTSSIDYAYDSAIRSPQLILYKEILDNDPEWKYPIHQVGFIVMKKQIIKDKVLTCQKCDKHPLSSRVKTCDHEYEDDKGKLKRCKGHFDIHTEFKVEVQTRVNPVKSHIRKLIMENIDQINWSIQNDMYQRNFNACEKPWGKCEYFSKCWYDDESQIIVTTRKR